MEDIEIVAPLFDAYLQFYKLPSNEEAARRYLHARLLKSEAVIFLAIDSGAAAGEAGGTAVNKSHEVTKGREKEPAGWFGFAPRRRRHYAGRGLGFTLLYPAWSSLSMRPWWILNDLYVAPEARKRGVAKALMECAQRLAEETSASGLGLETAKDNFAAQKLYEQLGWKREEQFYRYELQV
ncbi:MAG: GNAT family N-acetyltransferase [Acidobacteria bacterium]|nr:GNAT family N-acetyltransferase [Acidobacteriota bacterium]